MALLSLPSQSTAPSSQGASASQTPGLTQRLTAIEPVLRDVGCEVSTLKSQCDAVVSDGATASQVINRAASSLVGEQEGASLSETDLGRIKLANSVAQASDNDAVLVAIADKDHGAEENVEVRAAVLSQKLYEARPGALVAGLVHSGRVHVPDESIRNEVGARLREKPSLLTAAAPLDSDSTTVPDGKDSSSPLDPIQDPVIDKQIRQLRRINNIAPSAASVEALSKLNLTSAAAVASMSAGAFVRSAASVSLGEAEAREVHTAAVNTVVKHTNLLLSTVDIMRDNSPIIDGRKSASIKRNDMRLIAQRLGLNQVNLDRLFGGNDEALTEEWGTVYSPAAYFVDLLQYLKASMVPVDMDDGKTKGTALDYLLRKRPDLAQLDLTRENTETPVPYLDLVNEIMESFIVQFDAFIMDDIMKPRRSPISAYNVNKNDAGDLLWRPQNTQIEAYAYLADAAFPLTLPYHQPIDTARDFLRFLEIDRAELIEKFRSRPPAITPDMLVTAEKLRPLHEEKLDRLHDAEVLGMTEEEYMLLAKEGFQSPQYFREVYALKDEDIKLQQYNVRPVHECFGYGSVEDLEDATGTGLEDVKGQLLRRTGLSWSELVAMVQTGFVNPDMPEGRDLVIMNIFRASYRFLQTLIIPGKVVGDRLKHVRAKLLDLAAKPGTGRPADITDQHILDWTNTTFVSLGKVIVLDSNDGPFLRFRADQQDAESFRLVSAMKDEKPRPDKVPGGMLDQTALPESIVIREDGMLVDEANMPFGFVSEAGRLLVFSGDINGTALPHKFGTQTFSVHQGAANDGGVAVGLVSDDGAIKLSGSRAGSLEGKTVEYVSSSSNGGTTDIQSMKLRHLDGTPLDMEEWDRLHIFIRLWKKLGWTISEVDSALTAVGKTSPDALVLTGQTLGPGHSRSRISPSALRQLVTMRAVSALTGFPMEKTLTLWSDIPTLGEESLYAREIHSATAPGMPAVFSPDKDGRVLTDVKESGLSKNALNIKTVLDVQLEGLGALLSRGLVTDVLSIDNVSMIYRCKILSAWLGVSITQLLDLFDIFDRPLSSPTATLEFLQTWRSLQAAAFSVNEVAYIVAGGVDKHQVGDAASTRNSLSIDNIKIAVTCKDLRNQIAAINKANQPLVSGQEVTADMVRSKASQIFGEDKADSIMAFLDGTATYAVEAPGNLTLKTADDALRAKFRYFPTAKDGGAADKGQMQSLGTLTADEVKSIKGLLETGTTPEELKAWTDAVDALANQPTVFYSTKLSGIFPADGILNPKANNGAGSQATLEEKYTYFIETSLPPLVSRLSQAAVVASMAAAVSDTPDLNLVSNLLGVIETAPGEAGGKPETALAKLMRVGSQVGGGRKSRSWQGYLLVPQTDEYVFYFTGQDEPDGFHIDGMSYKLNKGKDVSAGTFHTDPAKPIRLNSHQLYKVMVYGGTLDQVQWQVPGSVRQTIPDSSVLPDVESYNLGSLFDQFTRACIVAKRFGLNAEDVEYINGHRKAFAEFDFNALRTSHLKSVGSFVKFRSGLPETTAMPLRNLFNWCEASSQAAAAKKKEGEGDGAPLSSAERSLDASLLSKKIADATGWDAAGIEQVLDEAQFFDKDPGVFLTERYLVQMGQMLEYAKKADVDIPSLFRWARPVDREMVKAGGGGDGGDGDGSHGPQTQQSPFEKQFLEYHRIATTIRLAAQSKCGRGSWAAALRPVNDGLREKQRNAMVQYLVNQDHMLAQNIQDADSLFEFFLVDVQTSSAVETSRLRQAISTVQLFVQRCFLGRESDHVSPSALDRELWDWMKNFSTWAANRKVFLYPENWIDPGLRDDKSPLFRELENELAQNELTRDSVASVVRSYVTKLASIANLYPVSLYVETGAGKPDTAQQLHIFARTASTPFEHHHRIYDLVTRQWTPWAKMNVEIPQYVDPRGRTGSYLVPAKVGNRLVVFAPQITNRVVDPPRTTSFPTSGPDINIPVVNSYLEIRMSFTEYQGEGRWSPRVLSADCITTAPTPDAQDLLAFQFLAMQRIDPADPSRPVEDDFTAVAVLRAVKDEALPDTLKLASVSSPGSVFYFTGRHISTARPEAINEPILNPDSFKLDNSLLTSVNAPSFGGRLSPEVLLPLQAVYSKTDGVVSFLAQGRAESKTAIHFTNGNSGYPELVPIGVPTGSNGPPSPIPLYQKECGEMVSVTMSGGSSSNNMSLTGRTGGRGNSSAGIKQLYDYMLDKSSGDFYGGSDASRHELAAPYSLYNWELGLHIPMLLVDRFLQTQQFEEALAVCHLVFDPVAPLDPSIKVNDQGSDAEKRRAENARFWRFKPFKDIQTMTLERYLLQSVGSKPGQDVKAVTDWRRTPFQPHLVARARPMAYMKWMLTKYIEILVAYGDFYFRQNTLDSVPNAIQMYVLASHLCGPRGQKIPRRNVKTMNYASLSQNLDAFSNAIVRLEERFPFSNQTPIATARSPTSTGPVSAATLDGLPTMFGFATAFYFSIPDNPALCRQRDDIDDRLFKIRHSQDINGVVRKLPLFDPPIDPGMLVKAKAQGLSLSSVLGSVSGPMPNYRFQWLLSRAMDMANEVKTLGASLLAAREKRDNEAGMALRARHESTVLSLTLDVKKQTLREERSALEATERSRELPAYRLKFYLDALGLNTKVPGIGEDFGIEAFKMEKPIEEGNLRLLGNEKLEMDLYAQAQAQHHDIGTLEIVAGGFHALPSISSNATPLGVGVAVIAGGSNIAAAIQAAAAGQRQSADAITYNASSSGRKAASTRAVYDRYLQLNQAGLELKNVDRQILTARIRVELAEKDVARQERQMADAAEYDEYLRTKFTSAELYNHLTSSVSRLYQDAYNHAYELASKAVRTFKYERPRDVTDYLQPTYWDPAHDGLLSGERLAYALKQLEAAHQSERGYDFELVKHVSLRQLDPIALMTLRQAHACNFAIPEAVYDLDFPGHYLRRIKSVSVSIPCVVGPYTSVGAVLRLDSHRYRVNPTLGPGGYAENRSGAAEDPRFSTMRVPIQTIATSSAVDDAGQFELSFRDERYVPFEGAGAISNWTLELPGVQPQFAYDSISDVVLHVRYTSNDGGAGLRKAAMETLNAALETASSGHILVDLRNEYASAWATVVSAAGDAKDRVMTMPMMESAVPFYLRGSRAVAKSMYILSDVQLPDAILSGDPSVKLNAQSSETVPPVEMENIKGPVAQVPALGGVSKAGVPLQGTWSLKFPKDKVIAANRVWMLIKYDLVE
ncbi:putative toxin subunit [Colletotrichum tofieldiae]|nr:putative toxin subunit [Colletotrichum tofieldiae]GKT81972.1 putative toxin subunit [Colletotrichum tofieldiae]